MPEQRVLDRGYLGIGGYGGSEVVKKKALDRQDVVEFLDNMRGIARTRIEPDAKTRVTIEPDGESASLQPGGGKRAMVVEKDRMPDLFKFIALTPEVAGKLSPATLGTVATELLHRKERFEVMVNGGRVMDFATNIPGADPIQPKRALNAIEKGTGVNGMEVMRAEEVKPGVAHLEIATYRSYDLDFSSDGIGDLIYAGASILLSPPGLANPEVDTWGLRQVCFNGSVSVVNFSQFKYTGGEGDEVWQWFRESTRKAIKGLRDAAEIWNKMRDDTIEPDQRAFVVEALIREAGLPISGPEADAIRAYALNNPPQNTWDAFNVITWGVSHLAIDPARRYRATRKLAKLADGGGVHELVCPTCHNRTHRRTKQDAIPTTAVVTA